MSKFLLGAVAVLLVLVSCAPESGLETLIPANAMAVAYVEHPTDVLADGAALLKALGQPASSLAADFPFAVLDLGRPMAAAVLPIAGAEDAGIPALMVFLPIKEPKHMVEVGTFASKLRGWTVSQVGGGFTGDWAVLATAGAPLALQPVADRKHFDLRRAHLDEGRGISIYVSMKGIMDSMVFPEGFTEQLKYLPALQKELDGLRLGLYPTVIGGAPGLRLALQTDLKLGSTWKAQFASLGATTRLDGWAPWLDDQALVSVGLALPPASLADNAVWAAVSDKQLLQHLQNLRDLIGPRLAVNLTGGLEPNAVEPVFSGVIEAKDPRGLRQALKSLVASGALQRNFLQFAMDADTPLVYQDQPGGPLGVRSRLTLGPFQVNFAWGSDKVYFASGKEPRAVDALVSAGRALHPVWAPLPKDARLLVGANPAAWAKVLGGPGNPLDGLLDPTKPTEAVRLSLKVETDGNPRLQLWWGVDGVRSVVQAGETVLKSLLTPEATP